VAARKRTTTFVNPESEHNRFSAGVRTKLDYYVYLLIDPTNDEVFYVGKGKGNRAFCHTADDSNPELSKRIKSINRKGMVPRIDILMHGITSEEAHRIETAAIDLLGVENITNRVRGWDSSVIGRMEASTLEAQLGDYPANITDPVLLIRINQLYYYGMSPKELYEATRGVWILGRRREGANYACAVYGGVIHEVYQITTWHPGGTTRYTTRDYDDVDAPDRWEFKGKKAPESVRQRYVRHSVDNYFKRHSQSPVRYINC
jgi:uncharacterized protein